MLFTFKKSKYFKFRKDHGIIDKILIVYFSIDILPNHCGYSFPFVQFKQNLWQIDCSANCRSSIKLPCLRVALMKIILISKRIELL